MYQVKEMTREEQIEMYRHVPLEELIEMLIETNRLLKLLGPKIKETETEKIIRKNGLGEEDNNMIGSINYPYEL